MPRFSPLGGDEKDRVGGGGGIGNGSSGERKGADMFRDSKGESGLFFHGLLFGRLGPPPRNREDEDSMWTEETDSTDPLECCEWSFISRGVVRGEEDEEGL